MLVVEILLIAVVVGVAVAVALGWGDRLVDVPVDRVPAGLPPGRRISANDVAHLRFNLALRGYRMDEVDAVLTELAAAVAERDSQIAELESHLAARGTLPDMTTLPAPGPDIVPPSPPGNPEPSSDPVPPSQPDEVPPLPGTPEPMPGTPEPMPAPGDLPH